MARMTATTTHLCSGEREIKRVREMREGAGGGLHRNCSCLLLRLQLATLYEEAHPKEEESERVRERERQIVVTACCVRNRIATKRAGSLLACFLGDLRFDYVKRGNGAGQGGLGSI